MGNILKPEPATPGKFETLLAFLAVAVLAVAIRFLPVRAALERATDWIDSLGWLGPFAFVAIYALCTVLFLPRSILTVAAGLLFGLGWGCLWVVVSANLGANLAFLAGRHFAGGLVRRWTGDEGRLAALDRAVGRDGWKIVALTRLSPVFPFALLNYAFGLTQVRWRQFALGSFLGMLPGTVLLVTLGTLADLAAEAGDEKPGPLTSYLLGGALLVAIAATLVVTRFARRAVARTEITADL